jgi:hypothetical protein
MKQLSEQQAYLALFAFLESEYQLGKSAELGAILGSMSLLTDGEPADPAIKEQWKSAVSAAIEGKVNVAFTFTK